MRDDFDVSQKFVQFTEDEQELIQKLIDAQKLHANDETSELRPTFLDEDESDDNSEEEEEGIKEEPFARVEESGAAANPQQTQVAVIGFWRQTEQKVFYCHHYFYVPNPMKRQIKEADGHQFN